MVKYDLKCFQVLLATGVRFYFATASTKMCALVMMMVPMLTSFSTVSGLLWDYSMVASLCILLKIFETGSEWTYLCCVILMRSSCIFLVRYVTIGKKEIRHEVDNGALKNSCIIIYLGHEDGLI